MTTTFTMQFDAPFAREALDERNRAILAEKIALLDAVPGPRVGDWIVFADGIARRISYVWDWGDGAPLVQTAETGSFYLGEGYVSFSGSLFSSIPASTLTLTDERRAGFVWFFRNNWRESHNGIDVAIGFRVYRSTAEAPR